MSISFLKTFFLRTGSIIGTVDIQPVPGKRGRYTLHPTSKESLLRLGIFPYDANNPHPVADDDSQGCTSSGKDDEFYEVEEVSGRRLSKDALMSTKSGLKVMGQQKTCGSPRPSLTDQFNLSLHPSLEEKENIPSTLQTS